VQDLEVMEGSKALDDLQEDVPDLLLLELAPLLLVLEDLLEQVAAVCVLHDDAGWDGEYQRDLVAAS
jgi:hypothetical protein